MNSSNSNAEHPSRREGKQPRFDTGAQQRVKYPYDPTDVLIENGGTIDRRVTHAQREGDTPGDAWPFICNYSEDLNGLRQLILEVAVVQFPNVVNRHREQGYSGPTTEAFRVLVLPQYRRIPDSDELQFPSWRAFLAIKTHGEDYHKMIVQGRPFREMAAAMQGLLIVLGSLLTSGTEYGPLVKYTAANFTAWPLHERWGKVDNEVLYEAEEMGEPRSQPAANNDRGHRNRQDNKKQQSGGRGRGERHRKENQQSGGSRRRERPSSSKKYKITETPGGRKVRDMR